MILGFPTFRRKQLIICPKSTSLTSYEKRVFKKPMQSIYYEKKKLCMDFKKFCTTMNLSVNPIFLTNISRYPTNAGQLFSAFPLPCSKLHTGYAACKLGVHNGSGSFPAESHEAALWGEERGLPQAHQQPQTPERVPAGKHTSQRRQLNTTATTCSGGPRRTRTWEEIVQVDFRVW